ncbi:MAG: toprim domain-containing protein [Magnetococcales bacterium]|nr:toprim domain-containing protein [Magnetococcales bacterium]
MNAAQLSRHIDLPDLASRLGMRRPGGRGNYHVPWREDNTPSLSIFGRNGNQKWKDLGTGDHGDAIDLVRKVKGIDTPEAMRYLHQEYGIPFDTPKATSSHTPANESQPQRIWRMANSHPAIAKASEYLTQSRRLPEGAVKRWQGRSFGFSDWVPKDGDAAAYGPAIVFPVVDSHGNVVAVNQRYLAEDHEPRMRTVGEMAGGTFVPSQETLKATAIWLTESPIDALTLTACGCPAVAFLSASAAEKFPFSWLNDRQRLMVLADADKPGEKAGEILYHRALSAGITAQAVDWTPTHKDPNDALKAGVSLEGLRELAGRVNTSPFPFERPWLPAPEFKRLQAYVSELDSTEMWRRQDGDDGERTLEAVAGFRAYRADPITVHDSATAMGGAAAGYAARKRMVIYRRAETPALQRAVIDDTALSNPKEWMKLGQVHNFRHLAHLLQALVRDQRYKHETVGVYGLVQVGEKIQLIDSSNGFLSEAESIYHRLRFPSAPPESARVILEKINGLLKDGLGVVWFSWFVGSMLKVFLGFWPHLAVSGHSGSGKTLIAKRVMCALTGCLSKEPTELQTSYRRMKAVSNHLFPVVFDEISRAAPRDLEAFVDLLNSGYRSDLRGHGQTGSFLVAGPVCLVGQDNPVDDAAINTKIVQFAIDGAKIEGGLFTPDGPFPVREWAEWLRQRWDRSRAETRLHAIKRDLSGHLKAAINDSNTGRFLENYSALQFAMEELCEFAGYGNEEIFQTLPKLMNIHLRESESLRQESVSIMDRMAREVMLIREQDLPPFKIHGNILVIPPKVILDFLSSRNHHFAIKSSRRLVDHLRQDGFLIKSNASHRIKDQKYKAVELDLRKLEEAGINWPVPDKTDGRAE